MYVLISCIENTVVGRAKIVRGSMINTFQEKLLFLKVECSNSQKYECGHQGRIILRRMPFSNDDVTLLSIESIYKA